MKKLIIETSRGATRNYSLCPTSQGFDVYRIDPGFFSSSKKLIGHGSSVQNAVLVARLDCGEGNIKATKLRDQ